MVDAVDLHGVLPEQPASPSRRLTGLVGFERALFFISGHRNTALGELGFVDGETETRRGQQLKEAIDRDRGLSKTACVRDDGSFHSQGFVVCNWLAATCRLAMWPIAGCVWCGTSSTPCASASAAQRIMPVMPPIFTMSGCSMRTPAAIRSAIPESV